MGTKKGLVRKAKAPRKRIGQRGPGPKNTKYRPPRVRSKPKKAEAEIIFFASGPLSVQKHAAVHHHYRTGHIGRGVASQKQSRRGDVVGHTKTAHRNFRL